jgi:hypothetical protein
VLFLLWASLASVEPGIRSSQFSAEHEDLTCILRDLQPSRCAARLQDRLDDAADLSLMVAIQEISARIGRTAGGVEATRKGGASKKDRVLNCLHLPQLLPYLNQRLAC